MKSWFTTVSTIRGRLPACPRCGFVTSYFLSDGRLQCRGCRHKYTPFPKEFRLDLRTIQELIALFWAMTPSNDAARQLDINRKTVQRFFHRVRLRIAGDAEAALPDLKGRMELQGFLVGEVSGNGDRGRTWHRLPLFGLFNEQGRVRLVSQSAPDQYTISGLEGLSYISVNSGAACDGACQEFWRFARRSLKCYRGGFRANFPLFMREMEFRYNSRQRADMQKYLYYLLMSGPL